jgi:hypothetical protein
MNSTINTNLGKREERKLMWVGRGGGGGGCLEVPWRGCGLVRAPLLERGPEYPSRPTRFPLAARLADPRTGRHTVADLHCASCDAEVGWMYIKAPTGDQRYKEGGWGAGRADGRPLHPRGGADRQGEQLAVTVS